MAKKAEKYKDSDVRDIVENEGLGYAVRHYMGSESIDSVKTSKLWDAAREALDALANHLGVDD